MDPSQLIFVNFAGEVVASIEYDIFLKYSTHFEDIVWDNKQRKETSLLTIPKYDESIVIDHLVFILSSLKLPVPTLRTAVNDVTPGLKHLEGNVANLEIYLLLLLNLEIDILINEVMTTLKWYPVNIDEIIPYYHIYTDILRSHKKDGYTAILNELIHIVKPLSPELTSIVDDIINSPLIDIYQRCLLCYKHYGPKQAFQLVDTFQGEIDDITMRKIDNLIPGVLSLLSDTRQKVIESITQYGHAARFGPGGDIFYFYVTDIDSHGDINVGKVEISSGDIWDVSIQYKHLFTVDDLKTDDLNPPLEQLVREVTPLIYKNRDDYVDAAKYHQFMTQARYSTFLQSRFDVLGLQKENMYPPFRRFIYAEDTKFRRWLSERQLLSESESVFLSKRNDLEAAWPLPIKINSYNDGHNSHILEQHQLKNIVHVDPDYITQFEQLQIEENKYYTTHEGSTLERLRQPQRTAFFNSSDRYGGLIIGLYFYNVISIDPTLKKIVLSADLFENTDDSIYHTLHLPHGVSKDMGILPRFTYLKYTLNDDKVYFDLLYHILHINTHHLYRNDAGSILCTYNFDEGKFRFTLHKGDSEYYDHVDDYLYDHRRNDVEDKSTFYIIDPSSKLINDMEDLKMKSNPVTMNSKPHILAYPYHNPKIFITAGLHDEEDDFLYIWFTLDNDHNITGLIRCNDSKLPQPILFKK
jgi:hypothetical protein